MWFARSPGGVVGGRQARPEVGGRGYAQLDQLSLQTTVMHASLAGGGLGIVPRHQKPIWVVKVVLLLRRPQVWSSRRSSKRDRTAGRQAHP